MNTDSLLYNIGSGAFFLIFAIKFVISVTIKKWHLTSEQKLNLMIVLTQWTAIFIFFLFLLRVFTSLEWITTEQTRIVGVVAVLTTLIGVVSQLFLQKKLDEEVEK